MLRELKQLAKGHTAPISGSRKLEPGSVRLAVQALLMTSSPALCLAPSSSSLRTRRAD